MSRVFLWLFGLATLYYREPLAAIRRRHDRINRLCRQRRVEQIADAPNPIGNAKAHRWGGPQSLIMEGERVVFTEETNPQNYLKLIASGEVDETMLEALEDYVKRQKNRLKTSEAAN